MAKQTIKKIADVERVTELARNNNNTTNPYDVNDTVPNIGGNAIDKNERLTELARNQFTQQKPYDINSLD